MSKATQILRHLPDADRADDVVRRKDEGNDEHSHGVTIDRQVARNRVVLHTRNTVAPTASFLRSGYSWIAPASTVKVVSIVGARPQFIKAAPVSRLLRTRHTEVLVHTGQHYDDNMSAVFFRELGLPEPDYHLGVGSGSHGVQTGQMLATIEQVLLTEQPDWTIVYGDTNSTAAGALAAAKLQIPVAHVEAGLRSFNRGMPEELNRIIADHLASLLLCPSRTAVKNLRREGIRQGVREVGDVMAEILAFAVEQCRSRSDVLDRLGLVEREYLLATIHRAENTDDPQRLHAILAALDESREPVVFPVHPRTRKAITALRYTCRRTVKLVEPFGYLDMVRLQQSARLILTDSGGMQKEAYWLGVPCVTLRDETEWVETVDAGWNVLAGADRRRIVSLVRSFTPPSERPPLYGDRHVARRILRCLDAAGVRAWRPVRPTTQGLVASRR
jgi:UDP-GlcNAc3NAcA epimerase